MHSTSWFALTAEDYGRLVAKMSMPPKEKIVANVVVGLVVGALGAYMVFRGDPLLQFPAAFLIFTSASVLIRTAMLKPDIKKSYALVASNPLNSFAFDQRRIEFDDWGISSVSNNGTLSKYPWSVISSGSVDGDSIVLNMGTLYFIWIPGWALDEPTRAALVACLERSGFSVKGNLLARE